jgi:lipopolysaccharide export system permease protein
VRILDKYLLREFLWPLLYCFDAFVMLMIVIDLFGTLDEFIDFHARLGTVVHYYLIKLPEMFVLIMPMSLLLALLFCLSSLGRHNELTAMRASGISLMRLALPLLGVGLAATIIVFIVNELFVPRSKEHADAVITALKGKGERGVLENFFFANATERRDWYARRFNTRTFEMDNPEVHSRRPDGVPDFDVYAEHARWINGQWHFLTADVYDHRRDPPVVTRVAETNFPSIKDPPKRLVVEGKSPSQLTSAELRRYIRSQRRAGHTTDLAKYEVTYHYRYAFPLTCLIVVLMGLPLGLQVSRAGPLLGVGTALVLVVAFYFLNNITLALGGGGHIPAVAAAWMTNVVFAAVGLALLARTR